MPFKAITAYYMPSDFDTNTQKLFGRISANESLLKAIVHHSQKSEIAVYLEQASYFDIFQKKFCTERKSTKNYSYILQGNIPEIEKTNLYFQSDPFITKMAWARNYSSSSCFSLCGLTHSIAASSIIEEINHFLLAPFESWDALICTSSSVKKVITEIAAQWNKYYAQRFSQPKFNINLQLPVIPLGIDTEIYPSSTQASTIKKTFRLEQNISEEDVIVLFVGRLVFYDKAHPIPMYIALEQTAQRMNSKQKKLYFLQVGWFENEQDGEKFKLAAKQFCPSVNVLFLDGRDSTIKSKIWSAADIFISLADNIQESFGLTPLEAMANGLPVIVSDWDGYKDTVRHGIDGFRIPSITPPAGCGIDLSLAYLTNAINYHAYCGLSAQMTAIDIKACVDALSQLVNSPSLCSCMGEASRKHIAENYTWKKIIPQYDLLWDELDKRRTATQQTKKYINIAQPYIADPFLTFAAYPTISLKPHHQLSLGQTIKQGLSLLNSNEMIHFGAQQLLALPYLEKIITLITDKKTVTVDQVVTQIKALNPDISHGVIVRSLTYLIKFNLIEVTVVDESK